MSTQGKFYGHATALVRHTMLQEVGRLKSLLGTDNAVTLKNIARIEGVAGAEAMKDEQLTTYIDLLHRSLPVHLQGIPASESIPAPSDATLTAQSEGGLREVYKLVRHWSALQHNSEKVPGEFMRGTAKTFGICADQLLGILQGEAPAPDAAGREALDLLDILFTAYEDGVSCYEDPEDQTGPLGNAVKIDDETFHRCADLLNRERPRTPSLPTPPPAAPEQSSAQPWAPVTDAELSAMLAALISNTAKRGDDMRAAGNALLALRGGVAQGVDRGAFDSVIAEMRVASSDDCHWAISEAKVAGWVKRLEAFALRGGVAQVVVVDQAVMDRALNAQPFAQSRNSGARVWQLFLDERDAEEIVRAALTAALAPQHEPQATLTEGGRHGE